jgi:hypothetical protein
MILLNSHFSGAQTRNWINQACDLQAPKGLEPLTERPNIGGFWLLITCHIECYSYGSFGSNHMLETKSSTSETDISSFYWAHLSRFHLKTETESSLQNFVYSNKDRAMDNVQNCDSYINIPSS